MTQHLHDVPQAALTGAALASAAWRKSSRSGTQGNCVEAAVLGSARWHKSNYSGNEGNCVEATTLRAARWRKSSRSGTQGNYVEVADDMPDAVAVRDSKNPAGPTLLFTQDAWAALIARVRRGESDRP